MVYWVTTWLGKGRQLPLHAELNQLKCSDESSFGASRSPTCHGVFLTLIALVQEISLASGWLEAGAWRFSMAIPVLFYTIMSWLSVSYVTYFGRLCYFPALEMMNVYIVNESLSGEGGFR